MASPRKKLVYDISASAVQMLITQLSGALVFYLLANHLSKEDIGVFSWSMAVLMIVFALLGCGLEPIVVKKIATGEKASRLVSLYLFHQLVTGTGFVFLICLAKLWVPLQGNAFTVILLLAVSQFFLFISYPFKQAASGQEKFRSLLYMSVIASLAKIAGLILLIVFGKVSLGAVLLIYLCASLLELAVSFVLYRWQWQLSWPLWGNRNQYFRLLKESFPQLGVVLFSGALARFDWVLLGILCTPAVVADYSFTYKFFELSTLPLLVLAPLLLPRIARMFHPENNIVTMESHKALLAFMQSEMALAIYTILVLNTCWTPVMDAVTGGKYGAANAMVICILSLSIPVLYLNNLLWSLHMSEGKLRGIFHITMRTCLINIIADLILIPFYQAKGAAVGFVLAMIVQNLLYARKSSLIGYGRLAIPLITISIAAFAGYALADFLFEGILVRLCLSSVLYFLLIRLTGTITFKKGFLLNTLSRF